MPRGRSETSWSAHVTVSRMEPSSAAYSAHSTVGWAEKASRRSRVPLWLKLSTHLWYIGAFPSNLKDGSSPPVTRHRQLTAVRIPPACRASLRPRLNSRENCRLHQRSTRSRALVYSRQCAHP